MGVILADHESLFEWSRQRPAFAIAAGVLLIVGGLLWRAIRRRADGWLETRAGRLAIAAFASLVVAVAVGSWPIQPDPYWVCGPVLHRWTESPLCIDELRPFRQAFVAFASIAGVLFAASFVLDRRQTAESGAPPPGISR